MFKFYCGSVLSACDYVQLEEGIGSSRTAVKVVVSHHVGAGKQTQVLEPSLQPHLLLICNFSCGSKLCMAQILSTLWRLTLWPHL